LWLGLVGLFYLGIAQLAGAKTYTGQQLIEILRQSISSNSPVYIALFCGLELGAMSHYSSDWLVSTYKRSPFRNFTVKPTSKQKKVPVKQARKSRIK
jgi:uncharacterized metal-binding protein